MRSRSLWLLLIIMTIIGISQSIIVAQTESSDIQQSFSEEGFPMFGDPDAPVEVIQLSSYSCPPCASFTIETFPLLLDRIRAGEIRYVFVPIWNIGGMGDGFGATAGAFCAATQFGFYEYSKTLFHAQVFFGAEAFTYDRLLSYAQMTNLDTNLWEACYSDDNTITFLDDAVDYSYTIPGFSSTPSIVVDGELLANRDIDSINDAIASALGSAF